MSHGSSLALLVWCLLTGIRVVKTLTLYGCFADWELAFTLSYTDTTGMTVQGCLNACTATNYAALRNSDECYCVEFKTQVHNLDPGTYCTLTCPGDGNSCGGIGGGYFSVYSGPAVGTTSGTDPPGSGSTTTPGGKDPISPTTATTATTVNTVRTSSPAPSLGTCVTNADCSSVPNTECTAGVCECIPLYRQESNECVKVLGNSCSVTSDCTSYVGNSTCTYSWWPGGRCSCANKYGEYSDDCVLVLGMTCTTSSDCSNKLANTDCTGSVCACATGYYTTSNRCKIVLGSTCSSDAYCTGYVANSYCNLTSTECECAAGYTQDIAQCAIGAGVGCTSNSDCVDNAQCSHGTCSCNTGFRQVNKRCDGVIGGYCYYTGDCTAYDENSACIASTCVCVPFFYPVAYVCTASGCVVTMEIYLLIAALCVSIFLHTSNMD